MGKATKAAGTHREHQVKAQLEAEGYAVIRGAGSHGCADLWAAKQMEKKIVDVVWASLLQVRLRLIQVKGNAGSPYKNFPPSEREELAALAAQTGGEAELCHWPPRGVCRWIGAEDWPQ